MRARSTGSAPSRENSEAWASYAKPQAISTSNPASAASRAAAIRSGREIVPNSGPIRIAARFSDVPSTNRPSAPTYSPGQGERLVKPMRSSLCACCTPAVRRCSSTTCEKSVSPSRS